MRSVSHDRCTKEKYPIQGTRGAFACLSLWYNVAGKILNISKSGLAFGYIANQKRTDESHKLDISFTDSSFPL